MRGVVISSCREFRTCYRLGAPRALTPPMMILPARRAISSGDSWPPSRSQDSARFRFPDTINEQKWFSRCRSPG